MADFNHNTTRTIAWDGLSFRVPATWDVSSYYFKKRLTSLELEDDYSCRLQAEWARLKKRPQLEVVRKRYQKAASRIAKTAERTQRIDKLPQGWTAYLYELSDKRRLAIAFVLPRDTGIFGFFQLHFGPADPEAPRHTVRELADTLQFHTTGMVPWKVYDVELELPARFQVVNTTFQAGLKMFTFNCGFRKLFIWQASMAHLVLKERSVEQWVAGTLNASPLIKGVWFKATSHGVKTRRSHWHPIGHYDEIGRCCFRYTLGYMHEQETNRLFLWCFNYRRKKDMTLLDGHIGPLDIGQ